MPNRINIRNVQMEWLNSRCLMQASAYIKAAYDFDQTVINQRDDDVLLQIRQHSRQNDDHELSAIYQKLKTEIKYCIKNPAIAKKISQASAT